MILFLSFSSSSFILPIRTVYFLFPHSSTYTVFFYYSFLAIAVFMYVSQLIADFPNSFRLEIIVFFLAIYNLAFILRIHTIEALYFLTDPHPFSFSIYFFLLSGGICTSRLAFFYCLF